jgi:hypothetical protein
LVERTTSEVPVRSVASRPVVVGRERRHTLRWIWRAPSVSIKLMLSDPQTVENRQVSPNTSEGTSPPAFLIERARGLQAIAGGPPFPAGLVERHGKFFFGRAWTALNPGDSDQAAQSLGTSTDLWAAVLALLWDELCAMWAASLFVGGTSSRAWELRYPELHDLFDHNSKFAERYGAQFVDEMLLAWRQQHVKVAINDRLYLAHLIRRDIAWVGIPEIAPSVTDWKHEAHAAPGSQAGLMWRQAFMSARPNKNDPTCITTGPSLALEERESTVMFELAYEEAVARGSRAPNDYANEVLKRAGFPQASEPGKRRRQIPRAALKRAGEMKRIVRESPYGYAFPELVQLTDLLGLGGLP